MPVCMYMQVRVCIYVYICISARVSVCLCEQIVHVYIAAYSRVLVHDYHDKKRS